jgi:molybdate-binding protein/DNA-binding XRE family transcriptional regulator
MHDTKIINSLAGIREKRGLSAAAVAALVGVSRQTIYAIEAGSYVPNTVTSLQLARVLGVSVEDLFSLPAAAANQTRVEAVVALSAVPGQPVQLCRIDERLVATAPSPLPWFLPPSDATLTGKTRAQIIDPDADFSNRILIAGCDPAISVLARHMQPTGIELVVAHRNSTQALALLKSGLVHVAGTHLQANIPEVVRIFPKDSVALFSFAIWEDGIVTATGNPKGIRGVEDFSRKDIGIVNREPGAGSRMLLDGQLKRLGIGAGQVAGYENVALGHLAAAWEVRTGAADSCIATRAAARAFGLGFIPLLSERYDFAIQRKHLELPAIQTLLNTLNRAGFRRELDNAGGYDTQASGQRMM